MHGLLRDAHAGVGYLFIVTSAQLRSRCGPQRQHLNRYAYVTALRRTLGLYYCE
jgi:hypothetical protein